MTTANTKRAEVKVNLGDEEKILRFSWNGLAKLKELFGDNIEIGLQQACRKMDFDKLADALVIGLEENWPDVTKEKIMEIAPPIIGEDAFTTGLFNALNVTLFGQIEIPEIVRQASIDAEKKSQRNGMRRKKTTSKKAARQR